MSGNPLPGVRPYARSFWRDAALATGIGAFLSVLGPFGTWAMGWPGVAVYWCGLVYFGFALSYGARILLDRYRTRWSRPLWVGVLTVTVALPMTAAILVPGAIRGLHYDPYDLALSTFYVWVITLGITVVTVLVERAHEPPAEVVAPAVTAPAPDFARRLPAHLAGGEIYAVQSEDHYLRIHTSRGDDLILMRLADALAELQGRDGLRVHRSWWVGRAAVEKIERDGGRVTLRLRNGLIVPVSRANQPELRASGWH